MWPLISIATPALAVSLGIGLVLLVRDPRAPVELTMAGINIVFSLGCSALAAGDKTHPADPRAYTVAAVASGLFCATMLGVYVIRRLLQLVRK